MMTVKVGTRRQVTIPKAILEELGLEPGDHLEVELKDGRIILTPKAIEEEEAWYWSKEWQAKEREADEAILKGEVLGPFENVEDALEALKKTKL